MKPRLFAQELDEDTQASAVAEIAGGGLDPSRATGSPPEPPAAAAGAYATPARPAAAVAAPLPKRPKGRLFISGLLFCCLATVGFLVWDGFFRFGAYGVITGCVVAVPPPWAGTVETLYVRDGDRLQQGDAVARLRDPNIRAAIERLTDELRVVQAELNAHAARLTLEAQHKTDQRQQALARYYEMMGDLLGEQSELSDLQSRLDRHERLVGHGAVSDQEVESLYIAAAGKRAKIERLTQAVAEQKKRVDADAPHVSDAVQLEPRLAKIARIQADIRRLRDKLEQGAVRAPVRGRVLRVHRYVGEYSEPTEPLAEILREGSLELVLYVRQAESDRFHVGQVVDVCVLPARQQIACHVARVGDRYEKAPTQVTKRYPPGEPLLPVILTPPPDLPSDVTLRVGGEIRLPIHWASLFESWWAPQQ